VSDSPTLSPSSPAAAAAGPDLTARLLLVLLTFAWGLTWPAMRIALTEVPPVSLRVAAAFLAGLSLTVVALVRRQSLYVPFGRQWLHLFVASFFNVTAFGLLSAFAQLSAATSRVTILAYTMPIWAALLGWFVLGERLTAIRALAQALCIAGVVVLVAPLWDAGVPLGLVLALLSGVSWAVATVYVKWADMKIAPIVSAVWQFAGALVVTLAVVPVVEGGLHVWPSRWLVLGAVIWTGLIGGGLAYYLWFNIVGRISASTASLGVLSVPLVGVAGSALILGERPTLYDLSGFVLIFLAAACVLFAPARRVG